MTEQIRKELERIHANVQLRKITTMISDELEELKERVSDLEGKR